jgi:hypothetical protein
VSVTPPMPAPTAAPSTPDPAVWTFGRLAAGHAFGSCPQSVTAEDLRQWHAIYGEALGASTVPGGMISILMMQAYMQLVTPRPPGNIHVAQSYRVSRRPLLGEAFRTSVVCKDKFVRKDRHVVILGQESTAGNPAVVLFSGEMTIFWAA